MVKFSEEQAARGARLVEDKRKKKRRKSGRSSGPASGKPRVSSRQVSRTRAEAKAADAIVARRKKKKRIKKNKDGINRMVEGSKKSIKDFSTRTTKMKKGVIAKAMS